MSTDRHIAGYVFHQDVAEARRRELGLTINQLADQLEVHRDSIRSWEIGLRLPPTRRVEELAEALELTMSQLRSPPVELLPAQIREELGISINQLAQVVDEPVARVRAAEDGVVLPYSATKWAATFGAYKKSLARAWIHAATTRPMRLAIKVAATGQGAGELAELLAAPPVYALRDLRPRDTNMEFADQLGVNSATVSRVEAGIRLPDDPKQWAIAYGTTEEELARRWLRAAKKHLDTTPDP